MGQKLCTLDQMLRLCQTYKTHEKTIVFTNGCFDILHAGHVSYLGQAAELGDILILGLNSDASVRAIKGDKRPVICQEHRIQVLSALECVDHLVLFDASDPLELITAIAPHVLVKGADWEEDQIVGAEFVKQHQGRVERIVLEPGISTTRIIQRIGELYYGQ